MAKCTEVPEGKRGEVEIEVVELDSTIDNVKSLVEKLVTAMEPITRPYEAEREENKPLSELCSHAGILRGYKHRLREVALTLEDLLEYQEL